MRLIEQCPLPVACSIGPDYPQGLDRRGCRSISARRTSAVRACLPPVELPLWPIVRPLQAAVLIAPVNLHPHDRGVVVVGASLEPRAHDNVRFRGKKAAPEPKRSVRTSRCLLPSVLRRTRWLHSRGRASRSCKAQRLVSGGYSLRVESRCISLQVAEAVPPASPGRRLLSDSVDGGGEAPSLPPTIGAPQHDPEARRQMSSYK